MMIKHELFKDKVSPVEIKIDDMKTRETTIFKYVRFATGDVRFCDIGTDHKGLINSLTSGSDLQSNPPAVSAGTIGLTPYDKEDGHWYWVFVDKGSTTAGLPWSRNDHKYIQQYMDKIDVEFLKRQ